MSPRHTFSMILVGAVLGVAPLCAQSWTTWYSAYEDGLDAQKRGDPAGALKAFQFAVAQRPEPGALVKTYAVNYISYHPYLRIAECALALGDLDRCERALADSARFGIEPSAIRGALALRLAAARAAIKPKESAAPPKTEELKSKPVPVETPRPLTPEPARAAPLKPAAPPPAAPGSPQPKAPPLQALPPPSKATIQPFSVSMQKTSEVGVAPPPAAAPIPVPPAPLPWAWIGAIGVLSLGVAGFVLSRRAKAVASPITVKHPTNPYRVDLNANTGGGNVTRLAQRSLDPQATAAHRRVGPYVITKVLGRGGCATTYLAVHEEDGTEVAVKIPHPHIVIDPDFLARFRREAELGAVLEHPRIVRILDPGPKEGDAWIAMTLVRGTTLEAFLTEHKGPLSIAEVVHLGFDVAEAIAYAHSKGVIHRDLKPANVMLGESGAQVMDFGIARLLDAAMTSTAVFIGTPNYAAPEAIINPRVGPPADRYALGIILFEMLAGEVPFKGETGFQVLDLHRSAPLPDIRALRPDAPSRLLRLVERLCMKAPDQRPEDGEVLHFLRELKVEFPLAGG